MIQDIPLQDVRNFCFIAHIDHGKSSLSSRILELTGNLGPEAQQLAWEAANQQQQQEQHEHKGDADVSATSQDNNKIITNASEKERIEALDTLSVEQQRGITVKASTSSMLYRHESAIGPHKTLLINMYDTPGHVDFGREVSRSLSFVQGAVLLLDATQGIQAQTWSVYEKVKALEMEQQQQHDGNNSSSPKLLIALTKVDLEAARPIHCALTLSEWLQEWDGDPDSILNTSARNRVGIRPLLDQICAQVPPPQPLADDDNDNNSVANGAFRGQVVDSWYDDRGVNCLIRIVSGQLQEGDRISILAPPVPPTTSADKQQTASAIMPQTVAQLLAVNTMNNNNNTTTTSNAQQTYPVQEVGIVVPQPFRTGSLRRGQMGYVRFGLRDPRQAMPGTLLLHSKILTQQQNAQSLLLPPTAAAASATEKSVLYASVHPQNADGFEDLCNAVDRLALNDTGLEVQKTSANNASSEKGGPFLGPGLRVGFQGLLHVEVFRQRLTDEFGIEAITTPPKVPYQVTIYPDRNHAAANQEGPITKLIEDLSEWPTAKTKHSIQEPMVKVRIVARVEDAGPVMDLISRKRGTDIVTKPIDEEKWIFNAIVPWAEVVVDFHNALKNVTAGFGSMDTFDAGYAPAQLHKVDILLNGDAVEPLAFVAHKDAAQGEARAVCQKLQQVLPRQQFVTVIQAMVGSRVIAAERIKAYRKDVLIKSGKVVGGGDKTRKMKLLNKQKEGKKRLQDTGKVQLSQAAFNSVITRNS